MKFTLDWLRRYIDFDLTSEELADRLTMAGLEVDSVEPLFYDLEGVKVARVTKVLPHPNADKLVLCDVVVGEESHRVVCGAPNAREGLVTAIALPGAVLPSGMAIRKSKIRGEVSEGMLCSEKDLGIGEANAGVMELPETMENGSELVEALHLKDILIEVDLTPNRPDCTSVLGIAREVGGFTGNRLSPPVAGEVADLVAENLPFSVTVESADDCPRYMARHMTDVKVGPSPWWLQRYLLAVGLRPINNVVDVTNFVMLEYGQPMHAFDFQKLAGGAIVVRRAKAAEKLVTLDGTEREVDPEILLICDGEKPVAAAGVMGGANSEVEDTTTEILLECACFNPVTIRRAARVLGLGTDSSYRFERGIDPEMAPKAMARASQLLCEIAGAQLTPGGIDFRDGVQEPPTLTLRVGRTNDLLGLDLSRDDMIRLLTSIEIETQPQGDDAIQVVPPSFRVDLEREVDLVEEIARLVGYNEIPVTLPMVPMSFPESDPERNLRKRLTSIMTSCGFHEAINYSFVAEKHFDMLGLAADHEARTTVRLLNPLGEDQGVMRTLLLPGLLENVRRNINFQNIDVKLFEIGKVFIPTGGEQPHEKLHLQALMTGRRHPDSPMVHFGVEPVDMFDARGAVEAILSELRLSQVEFQVEADGIFCEPGSLIRLQAGNDTVGELGLLSRAIAKAFGIKQDLYYLDLDLEVLGQQTPAAKQFNSLTRYPAVRWDLAVLVEDGVKAGEMLAAIEAAGESLVEKAEIFDVYRGKPIAKGSKSVALTVTYRSAEHTLDDETVGKVHKKLTDMILSRFHGKLREV